jgi:UDP-N-acetylglucosamine--N-acetylmuramyl-(pentapeptide) pyrophosphoryl-undecaprenol N-acetylglucosamine transferase
MTTILYGVSPIGLGHASRAVAIGSRLKEMGINVEFATSESVASFISSYGFNVNNAIKAPVPFEFNGKVRFSGLWYIRYWFGYRTSYTRMSKLVDRLKPELIVGDEEFSGVSIAIERGIKHALISDELELGFAKNFMDKLIESKVRQWYKDLQQRVSHLLIPDFGQDEHNLHYVTPIVRRVTKDRITILRENNLPLSGKLILFSMSGSGKGKFLLERIIQAFKEEGLQDTHIALVGGKKMSHSDGRVFNLGFIIDNQNLIAASDLVISLAGKSTIDEAMSYGTPIIAIPLKNHFEQERNAKALGFSYEDVDRIGLLMRQYIGRRFEPRNYQGAEKAASLLASLV